MCILHIWYFLQKNFSIPKSRGICNLRPFNFTGHNYHNETSGGLSTKEYRENLEHFQFAVAREKNVRLKLIEAFKISSKSSRSSLPEGSLGKLQILSALGTMRIESFDDLHFKNLSKELEKNVSNGQ